MTPLKLITPPAQLPVTLAEAKEYLRVDHTDEDVTIERLIGAATGYADGPDGFLARALIDQTWELTLDAFPPLASSGMAGGWSSAWCSSTASTGGKEIKIPLPPLIEVVNVFYDDPGGTQQIVPTSGYSVDKVSEPGWIVPVGNWPSTFAGINAVRVRFRAGYVDLSQSPAVGAVPDDIKQALLLYASTMFDQRQVFIDGRVAPAPWAAEQLLRRRRVEVPIA